MEKDKKLTTLLNELKADYLQRFPPKLILLKKLAAEKNWEEFREELHKIRGNGKTYGLPQFSVFSELVERYMDEHEGSLDPALLLSAIQVVERIYQSYATPEENKNWDFNSDPQVQKMNSLVEPKEVKKFKGQKRESK